MTTGNRPRPLSDFVPALTKGVFGSKNQLFGKMMTGWSDIAGPEIASKSAPLNLKFSKKNKESQAILHVLVQPAYALEFTYQKNLLVERLNAFFGYPAIKDIKIVQNSKVMDKKPARQNKARPVTVQEQQDIDRLVDKIQENDLQIALKNLGKAIISRQE